MQRKYSKRSYEIRVTYSGKVKKDFISARPTQKTHRSRMNEKKITTIELILAIFKARYPLLTFNYRLGVHDIPEVLPFGDDSFNLR